MLAYLYDSILQTGLMFYPLLIIATIGNFYVFLTFIFVYSENVMFGRFYKFEKDGKKTQTKKKASFSKLAKKKNLSYLEVVKQKELVSEKKLETEIAKSKFEVTLINRPTKLFFNWMRSWDVFTPRSGELAKRYYALDFVRQKDYTEFLGVGITTALESIKGKNRVDAILDVKKDKRKAKIAYEKRFDKWIGKEVQLLSFSFSKFTRRRKEHVHLKMMNELNELFERTYFDAQRRRLKNIRILATIAPLMGLLGTVIGMIDTFGIISLYGNSNPTLMAEGIAKAMLTTQAGLAVAVPMLVSATLLQTKLQSFSRQVKRSLQKLI